MGGTDEIDIEKNGRMEADGSERYVLVLEIRFCCLEFYFRFVSGMEWAGGGGRGWGGRVSECKA